MVSYHLQHSQHANPHSLGLVPRSLEGERYCTLEVPSTVDPVGGIDNRCGRQVGSHVGVIAGRLGASGSVIALLSDGNGRLLGPRPLQSRQLTGNALLSALGRWQGQDLPEGGWSLASAWLAQHLVPPYPGAYDLVAGRAEPHHGKGYRQVGGQGNNRRERQRHGHHQPGRPPRRNRQIFPSPGRSAEASRRGRFARVAIRVRAPWWRARIHTPRPLRRRRTSGRLWPTVPQRTPSHSRPVGPPGPPSQSSVVRPEHDSTWRSRRSHSKRRCSRPH